MIKAYFLVLLSILSIQTFAQPPIFEWAKSMGGNENEATQSIKTDATGNVYICGAFEGTVDFDPGIDTFLLTSRGNQDVFIVKLDGSGNFLWAKSIGDTLDDWCNSMTIDNSGNLAITGAYRGNVDFDPNADTITLLSNGLSDCFILKLSPNGNFIWVKSIGGTSFDSYYLITNDGDNNLLLTGGFEGTIDFNPGIGINILTSNGDTDMAILKLDSDGNFIWVKSVGSTGEDKSTSITVDFAGNIGICGNFQGTVDFDPGTAATSLTAIGLFDVFVLKLDIHGNLIWAKSFGGNGFNATAGLITNDPQGNLFISGKFLGTVDFDPGSGSTILTANNSFDGNVFISKFDSVGGFQWVKALGDINSNQESYSLGTDLAGNILVVGIFSGTVDFDLGDGINHLTSNNSSDIFALMLNANGNFRWAISMGGTGGDWVNSMTRDLAGNMYISGAFYETTNYNPAPNSTGMISNGQSDIFVLKLKQAETSVANITSSNKFKFYPNPTKNSITIELGESFKSIRISMFDIRGKLLKSFSNIKTEQINISLEEINSGVYFLKIDEKGDKQTLKIVKE